MQSLLAQIVPISFIARVNPDILELMRKYQLYSLNNWCFRKGKQKNKQENGLTLIKEIDAIWYFQNVSMGFTTHWEEDHTTSIRYMYMYAMLVYMTNSACQNVVKHVIRHCIHNVRTSYATPHYVGCTVQLS